MFPVTTAIASFYETLQTLDVTSRYAFGGNLGIDYATISPLAALRNIRVLHNFEPPTTDDEVREAALQFVRKVSGSTRPSRVNAEPFDRAIDEIAVATRRLLDALVTNAPPKSREAEAIKGRARHEARMKREVRIRTAS